MVYEYSDHRISAHFCTAKYVIVRNTMAKESLPVINSLQIKTTKFQAAPN